MKRLQKYVPLEYPGKAYFWEPLGNGGYNHSGAFTEEENNILELLTPKISSWNKKVTSLEVTEEIINAATTFCYSNNLSIRIISLIGLNMPLMEAIHSNISIDMLFRSRQDIKEESYSQQRKHFIGSTLISGICQNYYTNNLQGIRI